jgi:hypothetical protein
MLEILFPDLMIVVAIPVVSGKVQYLNFICMILGGAQSRCNTEAVISNRLDHTRTLSLGKVYSSAVK